MEIGGDSFFPSDPGGLSDFASTAVQSPAELPGPSVPTGEIADWQVGAQPTPPGGFKGFVNNIGTGFKDFAGKLGGEILDSPLKSLTAALGLGATGAGIAGSLSAQKQAAEQQATTKRAQKQAEAAAAPAVSFGTTTLNAAAAGNLPPGLQAGIDQWVQQQKAQVASRFAAMGLGNSDQIDQANRLIDQQAMAMKGQLLQQQEETGLAGLQTGVSAATGVMGSSNQQQQQLEDLIAKANKAMGSIGGGAA